MYDENVDTEAAPISVRPDAPGGTERSVSIRLVLRADRDGAAISSALRHQGMDVAQRSSSLVARGRVSVPPSWDASNFGDDMVEQFASAGIPLSALSVVFYDEARA